MFEIRLMPYGSNCDADLRRGRMSERLYSITAADAGDWQLTIASDVPDRIIYRDYAGLFAMLGVRVGRN